MVANQLFGAIARSALSPINTVRALTGANMMNKTTQTKFAGTVCILGVAALAAIIYLAIAFPKILSVWADQGRALSSAEQTVADLSMFCKTYGRRLLPVLLAVTVSCGTWAIITRRGSKQ